MLKKANRVTAHTVKEIFQKGRFVVGPNLTFKYLFYKEQQLPALSFVAPKSVAKGAVARNKLRRRGGMALSELLNKFPKNISGVFVFGKNSLEIFGGRKKDSHDPVLELSNEIKNILHKIN